MRIVAWNCCRGPLEKKLAALAQLTPDIAVISETMAPAKETNQLLWFPSNASRLGIQVRAFNDFRPRRVKRDPELPNCVVPLDYGREAHATHHFLRRPERPFHIDFCFVPQVWAERRLEVQIAKDGEWPALSDHFPLVVDTHPGAVNRMMARG